MLASLLVLAWRLALAPTEAEAAAGAAWDAERWDEASGRYAAIYAETHDPVHLYAQAQAERFAGRCAHALPLYRRLLADDVPADASTVEAAHANIATCEAQLPAPAPKPVAESPPIDTSAPRAREQPPSPWHRDPAGRVLVGLGLATLTGGAVLLGVAASTGDEARASADDRSFGNGLERARDEVIAGSVLLGIGGAVLVSGIVRWAVLAKGSRRRTEITLGPRGVVLTGRF